MNLLNPISLIPAPWLVWLRIAALLLVVALVFGAGWKVKGAMDSETIADLRVEHANLVTKATAEHDAALRKVQADHEALAGQLATSSANFHEALTRSEHANDLLRADVAAGTRVVRVAAACPGKPGDLPEAAAGGRVDPAAGPVLDPAAGQAVLDLRARILATETQLAACQDAAVKVTGQAR